MLQSSFGPKVGARLASVASFLLLLLVPGLAAGAPGDYKKQPTLCNLSRSPFVLEQSLPEDLQCEFDQDGNGLDDEIEKEIAHCFVPTFRFDWVEEHRRPDEPHVLFTSRRLPQGEGSTPNPWQVQLKMLALFREDGGFDGGFFLACGDNTHPGDVMYYGVNVEIMRGSNSWMARLISFDGCSEDEHFFCEGGHPSKITQHEAKYQRYFNDTHPVVYPSAGKHHSYVFSGFSTYEVTFDIDCDDAHRGHGAVITPGTQLGGPTVGHVPTGVLEECHGAFGPSGEDCRCFPSWQNMCYFSRGVSVPIQGFQDRELSNLGYSPSIIDPTFYDVSGIWGQLKFSRPSQLDLDGDGTPDIYGYARSSICLTEPSTEPVIPTDRCPFDANDADDPNADGDALYGACDPDPFYRNQYVGGGSEDWPSYRRTGSESPWVTSSRFHPRGGFWDSDGDGHVEGEDLCPTVPGGGALWDPTSNWNAWGEDFNFAFDDGRRDVGFLYRGNRCDPYPATLTQWTSFGEPYDTVSQCSTSLRYEKGGAEQYELQVRVQAGKSANDPALHDPGDNREFQVQPFRCACPSGPLYDCMTNDLSPCYEQRLVWAEPQTDPGELWRPVQRPGCPLDEYGYCLPLTLPNHTSTTVTWDWFQEYQNSPDHFPSGSVTTSPEHYPGITPSGGLEYMAGNYGLWTATLEGASFSSPPGLAFNTPVDARFPEPERINAGAVLHDITGRESRSLRSSFATPVQVRGPYIRLTQPGSHCEEEPLFDPCVVAGCGFSRWWQWTVRPAERDRLGSGLFRDLILTDVWFWQRRGGRLLDTYLGKADTGILSLALDEVNHWAAGAAGQVTLLSAGEVAPSLLFVEHSTEQARWVRLEAIGQDADRVVFTPTAEGTLPTAITSHARLISDPRGQAVALIEPELDELFSFDPALQRWLPQPLSVLAASLAQDTVTLAGGRLYVAPTPSSGGWTVDIYSGEATEWALPLARAGARLTPSVDGQGLLLSGGADAAGAHDDVWFIPFAGDAPHLLVADSSTPKPEHATRALVSYSDGTQLVSVGAGQDGRGIARRASKGATWSAPECLPLDLKVQVAYSASQLWVGAGAQLFNVNGLANAASQGDARVGIGASLGSLLTAGNLSIGIGAQLSGDAFASGSVINHGAVAGQVSQGAAVQLSDLSCFQVAFPPAGGAVDVLPHVTRTLAPGSYARAKLLPKATLKLRAGSYFFKRFEALPLARVELDTSAGPVRIFVQEQLSMLGNWEGGPAGAERILLAYLGSSPLTWVRPLAGTLLAPSAAVTLGNWEEGALRGAFFAHELNVLPGVHLHHVPFRAELLP
ncbi:MAG: hypothetical protein KF915_20420 [Polyangiaceae bacterium]|nr:hypothetical protein [Polyangiaceae bacterium]